MTSPRSCAGRMVKGGLNGSRIVTPGRSRLGLPGRVLKAGNEAKVRVVLRVRPFLEFEQAEEASARTEIFKGSDGEDTLRIADKLSSRVESYKLDACYDDKETIATIFAAEVEPILPTIFSGYNATVFAYGATGSGKTHSMQGDENLPGLMPLALENILAMAEVRNSKVEVSFYEVYMDRCYDLLESKISELLVLEDSNGRVQLRGLAQVQVKKIEEFHAVFAEGCANRRTGPTGLNDVSNRSHSVLSVTVTSNETGNRYAELAGKLNLIDLAGLITSTRLKNALSLGLITLGCRDPIFLIDKALRKMKCSFVTPSSRFSGSENNRKTGNDGVRLVESTAINKSLFALSNVINALNANETRVPYRDSKLTRILQDSLGGTSRAVMIACLNPGCFQESSATLSMAAKSRQVINRLCFEDQEDVRDEKLNMEEELNAWLESKNRTRKTPISLNPIPLRVKAPVSPAVPRTPLRRCLNLQLSSGTPKARRVLVEKARANGTRDKGDESKGSFDNSSCKVGPEKDIGVVEEETDVEDVVRQQHPSRVCHDFGANKENISQLMLTSYNFSVNLNSPPLSARLKNLSLSLRALTPLPLNAAQIPEREISPLKYKAPNVDLTPVSSKIYCQSFNSPPPPTACEDFLGDAVTPLNEDLSFSMLTPYTGTPFDRFSKGNPELQMTLVKEYLNILNTASREELLQLKGIGPVRAGELLKLREGTPEPLKQFEDLQNIGLSVRQAHAIFNTNVVRQVVFPKG